jgi:hypothetical protein
MKKRPLDIDGDVARVPLTQGQTALVDAADAEIVAPHNWHALWVPNCRSFIARTHLPDGKWTAVSLHSLLTGWRLVDHVNHDTLDNRRENLREASALQNARNRHGASGASGYLGVYPKGNRWTAAVRHDGTLHHVGSFAHAEDAARARDNYIREHFPACEFWTLNFPL